MDYIEEHRKRKKRLMAKYTDDPYFQMLTDNVLALLNCGMPDHEVSEAALLAMIMHQESK